MAIKPKKIIATVALTCGLIAAVAPASAYAVTSAELASELKSVEYQLNSLRDEMSLAAENYNLANREHEAAVADVAACQQEIDATQKRVDELQNQLATRAVSMYRSGASSYLDVLMGVSSFGDFVSLWDTLIGLNENDAQLVSENVKARTALEMAKSQLVQRQADAQEQLRLAAEYQAEVESMTANYNAMYNNLSAELQQAIAQEQAASQAAAMQAQADYMSGQSTLVIENDYGEQVEVTYDSSTGSYVDSSGNTYSGDSDAVARAYAALGVNYVYGASSADAFDCSGLVSYAITGEYGHAYVSQDFWGMSEVSDPQPGDVVACSSGHCGLYIGDGKMIEAPYTGAQVTISDVRGKIVRP